MPLSFICDECVERSTESSNAMRFHARLVQLVNQPGRSRPARVDREYLRDRILASFIEAQSAWDNYREHLIQHGVVPAVRFRRVAA